MNTPKQDRDIPLENFLWKADAAFQQAARKVILKAKQTNTPIIVWEDSRIKEVPAADMEARLRHQ